ncbi:ATP-binding protein [Nanoarchaeota archaeon]
MMEAIKELEVKERDRETGYFVKITEEIPSTEEDIMDLADKVFDDMDRAAGMETAVDCYYALVEAMNNSLMHGNQGNPSKKIKLVYLRSDKKLSFSIEDEGEGFDVATIDQKIKKTGSEFYYGTGGFGDRGLSMIAHLMDRIKYNDLGNVIRMEKYL